MLLHMSLFLWASQLNYKIIPIRAIGEIGIAYPHLCRFGVENRIAMDLIVHPPSHRRLRTTSAVDDLFRVGRRVAERKDA